MIAGKPYRCIECVRMVAHVNSAHTCDRCLKAEAAPDSAVTRRDRGTDQPMSTLDDVRRSARAKARADVRYREAIAAALTAGHSYAEIAKTLGVSRQAVRQYAQRP